MDNELDQLWLEEVPDAVVVTDIGGTVTRWSKGATALFEYRNEEAATRLLDDLIVPPDRRGEAEQMLRETLQQGSRTFETVRRRKDGLLLHVDVTTKLVRDTRNGSTFALSSIKDVTDLQVLRDAKLVEARFGQLLESMPDGIVMVNRAGRIVLANSQAEGLFAYGHGELRGRLIEELVPPRYRSALVGHRSSYFPEPLLRAPGPGLELFGLRKDGVEFPVGISLGPLETEDASLVISAIRDITERKGIEQALNEKNLELRNAAEAKNRFLASMSHELRTPLNGIIGFAEFLVDGKPGPLNSRQKEYLEDILSSGRHLLRLINDVLDLAKVEAGRMTLNPESFPLGKAIGEVCAVARPLAQKKRIKVATTVAPDMADITLDQQKFKQILYNLLSNALKFTEDGGRVDIAVETHDPLQFSVAVRDTGIGIKQEDLPRLFREFEQIETGVARRFDGTGLGLALTRRLVEMQGGNISVASEWGAGSTFTVTLPLNLPADPALADGAAVLVQPGCAAASDA